MFEYELSYSISDSELGLRLCKACTSLPLRLMLRSIKYTKTPGQKRVKMGNISPRQLNDGSKIGNV